MAEEWSNFHVHNGEANPGLVGHYVHAVLANNDTCEGVLRREAMYPAPEFMSLWIWDGLPDVMFGNRVVKYRVRRPKGMEVFGAFLRSRGAPGPVREEVLMPALGGL